MVIDWTIEESILKFDKLLVGVGLFVMAITGLIVIQNQTLGFSPSFQFLHVVLLMTGMFVIAMGFKNKK